MIWAVVPVKELNRAKQRLAGVLGPEQRHALSRSMLEDVLTAIGQAHGLAGLLVVSSDPDARLQAGRHGARLLDDPGGGLNAALEHASAVLTAEGTEGMLILPADSPLANPAEIEAVLGARGSGPAVAIAPDRRGDGTNALLCAPPDLISFRYGPGSFRAHCEAAQAAGIEPRILDLPGLAFDIDTPEDLAAFTAIERPNAEYRFLLGAEAAPRPDGRTGPVRKVV